MPDSIDLYVIHRLERRQSPTELAAQLTSELNNTDPRDQLTRSRIETARVILGDPERRARYDRQLDDPAAPEITEQTLAQLSGRAAPTAPRRTLSKPVAAFVAITVVVVVIALVGIIVALVNSGGDDHTSKSATAPTPASATPGSSEERGCNCRRSYAEWDTGATPRDVIQLEKAFALPPAVTTALQQCEGDRCALKQYQDKSVGVQINPNTPGVSATMVAIYSPEGQLVSFKPYPLAGDVPEPFDLQKRASQGYYRIAGGNVEIPATANGTESEMNYALALLPDAFDSTVLWVLLRGGTQLYKAYLHSGS